jgi:DNA replication protein DnaD
MRIKRGKRCVTKKIKPKNIGGVNMVQENLLLNHAYIIREDMAEKFLNLKPNKEKLSKILERANRAEKNIRNRE